MLFRHLNCHKDKFKTSTCSRPTFLYPRVKWLSNQLVRVLSSSGSFITGDITQYPVPLKFPKCAGHWQTTRNWNTRGAVSFQTEPTVSVCLFLLTLNKRLKMGRFPNSFDNSTTGYRAERPTASSWSMTHASPNKPDVTAEEWRH